MCVDWALFPWAVTYVEVDNANGELVRRNVQDMMGGMHIPIPSVMEKLPSFYWLPKLYKTLDL